MDVYWISAAIAAVGFPWLGQYWLKQVNEVVPAPYLDEVFHVRQAQTYCVGQFHVWDPKITTPPGLYLLGYLAHFLPGFSCSIGSLRLLNFVGLLLATPFLLTQLVFLLYGTGASPTLKHLPAIDRDQNVKRWSAQQIHRVLNICLFPVLFFFSALFYTDIWSTFFVLARYHLHLKQKASLREEGHISTWIVFLSRLVNCIALLFRQTNIFWVAVYIGGLKILDILRTRASLSSALGHKGSGTYQDVISQAWQRSLIYEVDVGEASLEDYVKTALSVLVAAMAHTPSIVIALTDELLTIGLFMIFVAWNGGVVLGDKSNHVATIHLPQMLYIWPYMTFFSWPLILPYILQVMIPSQLLQTFSPAGSRSGKTGPVLPRLWVFLTFIALAIIIVHFNTIIHPFTLADNRHYMFYVFRILRRHKAIQYAVTPVYILSGWLCLRSLGKSSCQPKESTHIQSKEGATSLTSMTGWRGCNTTAFVLIWLATTALSLVTAPLVEPRYFIIPWSIWRLHLPLLSNNPAQTTGTNQSKPMKSGEAELQPQFSYDYRLWLETVWFLLVNALTGYVFLFWGYEWKQEPGQTQRFMW